MTWRPSRPAPSERDPRPVAASLEALARDLGAPPPRVSACIFGRWQQLAGADLAAHARPVVIRDQILTVGVDQPAWAVQIQYLSATLLRRVQEEVGEEQIKEIRVKVLGEDSWRRRGARPLW